MRLYIGPLGYANSQALVCFDHTTPNNSLPILWESRKRSDNQKRWTPLFPRKLFDRVRRDEDYGRMKYHWISIARKINEGRIRRLFNGYNKEAILLLGLLHCLHRRRSEAYMRVMLELSEYDLASIKKKAFELGLLTSDGHLSEEGRLVYGRIRKEEFESTPLIEFDVVVKNELYLPTEFLGFPRY